MISGTRNLKITTLLLGDIAAMYLALLFTVYLRYHGDLFMQYWRGHVRPFSAIFLLWIVILFIVGLYEFNRLRNRIELVSRTGEALGAALLASVAIFYLVPGFRITPKTNLAITLLVFAVLFLGWRILTMHLFSRHKFRLRLIFLGQAPETNELVETLTANPHLGYHCLGVIEGSLPENPLPESDIIVVSHQLPNDSELTRTLYSHFFASTVVIDLPTFYEEIRRQTPESAMDKQWVLHNIARHDSSGYELLKRPLDFLLATILTIPALVLTPFIALAVWLEDRGPIFFRQLRVGKNGRLFQIIKFRTMQKDAELLGVAFATKNDSRINRVRRFLRQTRLDEIPQLWNILRGDMSFVGPRPERPEIEKELTKAIPLFPVRRLVRPGLTGWAQVHASYASTLDDHKKKLRHDLYYLKRQSVALDAAIVLKTIYSVLKRKGR